MADQPPGFCFTSAMRAVCVDVAARLPELRHLDVGRIAIGVCQTRRDVAHGMYASLTPLRLAGGRREEIVRGRRRRVQSLRDADGREYLYLLNFYLPRFMNANLEWKLSTILHELWHVSPAFDGDLRRFPGRCYAHGPSQKQYDAEMDRLAQRWLQADPPCGLYEFLTLSFGELAAEYGCVAGERWPAPKLLPA